MVNYLITKSQDYNFDVTLPEQRLRLLLV